MQTETRLSSLLMLPILPITLLIGLSFIAVCSLMILSQRLLIVTGFSDFIATTSIAIFALFTAIGCLRAMSISNNQSYYLKRNFILLTGFIGIGLSALFITLFLQTLTQFMSDNFIIILGLYLLSIIAPIAFLIGENIMLTEYFFVPFTKIMPSGSLHKTHSLIWIALGFFLAMIMMTLVINLFGLAWSIIFITSIIFLLYLLLTKDYFNNIVPLSILGGMIIVITAINLEPQVYPLQTLIYMPTIFESELVSHPEQNATIATVTTVIQKILFNDLQLEHRNILVLSDTLFNLNANSNNHFMYVSKNISNKLSACHYLDLLVAGNTTLNNSPTYLNNARPIYDVIIADLTNQTDAQLANYASLQKISQALTRNGYALFNVIAKPTLMDTYSKNIDTTIHSVFENCLEIPVKYSEQPTNIIYVCKKNNS